MNELPSKGLLPPGLGDVLPPDAAFEAKVVSDLAACFASHGYDRVKPPMIEFEESLLGGAGAATARQTFRLMDPVSHHMMGVRSDMTVQVARIATQRLGKVARPLRLCYAGQVLRVKGNQLRPERQFGQAGVELIGSESLAADAEVVALAMEVLGKLGAEGIWVDLNMPTLVPAVCAGLGLDGEAAARLCVALDRKDAAAVAQAGEEAGGEAAALLEALLAAAGPADKALAALSDLELPPAAAAERDRLCEGVARIRAVSPDVRLTIDPVEHRGFEYHTGISFTLFARGVRGELGRGGRYRIGAKGENAEPGTGFTLFMDTVLRALPAPVPARRLFLPAGTPVDVAARWRAQDWVAVDGLAEGADPAAEARRLGCSHALVDGNAVPID